MRLAEARPPKVRAPARLELVRVGRVGGGQHGGAAAAQQGDPLLDQQLHHADEQDELAVLHLLGFVLNVPKVMPEMEQRCRLLLRRKSALPWLVSHPYPLCRRLDGATGEEDRMRHRRSVAKSTER